MPDLADTLTGLADTLTAAGVRATIDARDLNPPAVLVAAPVIRWAFGNRMEVDYRLVAVVPDAGTGPALKALSGLLDDVSAALGGAPLTATPMPYADPGGGNPLPAYEITWTAKQTPGKG